MKTHQSRPVVDELQELHAIAMREHGPHAHSTRLIDRALTDARRALHQPGPASASASPSRAAAATGRPTKPRQEGPAR